MRNLVQAASIYRDQKIISIFLLGIISGLPWVMIGSALTIWLQEAGISRSAIGFSGLIFFVYAINFFWAPFIDRIHPLLKLNTFGLNLGGKQAWVILCQGVIALSCVIMSQFSPEANAKALILCALALACASATQDIAIDAYRIQSFLPHQKDKISAGAAAATGGWWTGYSAIGFIPLALSDTGISWPLLYWGMAGFTGICLILCFYIPSGQQSSNANKQSAILNNQSTNLNHQNTTLASPETRSLLDKYRLTLLLVSPWFMAIWAVGGWQLPPTLVNASYYPALAMLIVIALFIFSLFQLGQRKETPLQKEANFSDKVLSTAYQTLIKPLQDFILRNGVNLAISLLGFVFLFKIGEAFLGRMSIVFYKELGFSKTQIAFYSKTLTWVVTLCSAIPAGLLNARLGLFKSLMISGFLMALSNLLFCAMAITGPVEWLYAITVIIDGFTAAWATVAFVAFVSHLCTHQFSATQYALFASLGAFGRTTLSSNSGLLVDSLNGNWALFFALTALMVIPSLALLWWLRDKLPETKETAPASQ